MGVPVAVAVAVAVGVGGAAVAVAVAVALGGGVGWVGGTKTGLLVPAIELSLRSVAVIVWFPGVLRVTTKKAVPLVRVVLAGRVPLLVLVKRTLPE